MVTKVPLGSGLGDVSVKDSWYILVAYHAQTVKH